MRPYDLIAFDVDGTLVRHPAGWTVWEVLNDRFTGRPDCNEERYARYRAGSLSYEEWVALDIGGWKAAGATRDQLIESFASLSLVHGTRDVLEALVAAGCRLFVISGTLDLMLHTLLPESPFEEIYCNHIGFDDAGRIGHWRATPFDMEGKAKALRAVALREGLPLKRCAFVGDSSNDVWIAREAGFSIAFNPRSAELEQASNVVLRSDDLHPILDHLV